MIKPYVNGSEPDTGISFIIKLNVYSPSTDPVAPYPPLGLANRFETQSI